MIRAVKAMETRGADKERVSNYIHFVTSNLTFSHLLGMQNHLAAAESKQWLLECATTDRSFFFENCKD